MKKFLAIILSLIFVLSMATVSFAANSTITADDYEWLSGFATTWPNAGTMTFMGRAENAYVMMKDKVVAGTVSVKLANVATSYTGDANVYELGFYFKADIDAVRDSEDKVTGGTVNDAYLVSLNNKTHDVTLYRVTNDVKTKLVSKDIDTLINTLTDNAPAKANVGAITLEAVFAADGKVTINAAHNDGEKTKVFDYAETGTAPEGTDVVLSGYFANASGTPADDCLFADYSATCTHDGLTNDADGHWYVCTACGETTVSEDHDTDGENGACSVCGYTAPAAPDHYKPGDSEVIDVYAIYVDGAKTDAYSVEIAWGAMQFQFVAGQKWNDVDHVWETLTDGGEWQVAGTEGTDNLIKVTNHSSKAVSVELTYAEFEESGVVAGTFSNANFDLAAPEEGGDATEGSSTFMPTGTFTATDANKADFVKIGTITVTIGEYVPEEPVE